MKRFATLAACTLVATLLGCQASQSTDPTSPGAVEGGSKCCTKDGACAEKCSGSMGAVSGKSCDKPCDGAAKATCPATGASMGAVEGKSCDKPCTKPCTTGASMGAVEGKSCDKPCTKPCAGSASGTSMGAVGEAKSGCCKSAKSGCTK